MSIVTRDSRLAGIIFEAPQVLQLLNRFGIFLGVGDHSLREICEAHRIDTGFFLTVVNTYLNEDYYPEKGNGRIDLERIIVYLEQTDNYYASTLLPNIERHFATLVARSGDARNNLPELQRFFMEMKREMSDCINHDQEALFPALRHSASTGEKCAYGPEYNDGWMDAEAKLCDLITFFVRHLRGIYDPNLCVAVVSALITLSRDVDCNNRIRERLLRKAVKGLESRNDGA